MSSMNKRPMREINKMMRTMKFMIGFVKIPMIKNMRITRAKTKKKKVKNTYGYLRRRIVYFWKEYNRNLTAPF